MGTKARSRVARRIKIPKKRVSLVFPERRQYSCRDHDPSPNDSTFTAPAAEPVKADQGKSASSVQKTVENGNQGLTQEEIMQKKREEFFKKRMGGPTEKARQVHPYKLTLTQRVITDYVSHE